jgi:cyclic beta-1,2-glucan synthetase
MRCPARRRAPGIIAVEPWRFFEAFVDDRQHALPPDNFQEDPEPVSAHRTSPTNMGLYLLSILVAHDFGWLGRLDTVERLEGALKTMANLRRHRGHFFNWYDTESLRPLDPRYVSTVDSGNLAGHLIALAQGTRDLLSRPLFGREVLEGIGDNLRIVLGVLERAERPQRSQLVTRADLRRAAEAMLHALDPPPGSLIEWGSRLHQLETQAENLMDMALSFSSGVETGPRPEILFWTKAVHDAVRSHARDFAFTLPWCAHLCTDGGGAGSVRKGEGAETRIIPPPAVLAILGAAT